MYAVIKDGGRQYRVEPSMELRLDYRGGQADGSTITFEDVLLAGNNSDNLIGRPLIEGAKVTAEVIRHLRGEKLEIGKYKRRKNFRRHTGHRQEHTLVCIRTIEVPGLVDDTPPAPAAEPIPQPEQSVTTEAPPQG